jgi:hypothetical protein
MRAENRLRERVERRVRVLRIPRLEFHARRELLGHAGEASITMRSPWPVSGGSVVAFIGPS